MEMVPSNLNQLVQVVIKKHGKTNNFINYFIPLKADRVFAVSSGNRKR
jgi:hypothetical protein